MEGTHAAREGDTCGGVGGGGGAIVKRILVVCDMGNFRASRPSSLSFELRVWTSVLCVCVPLLSRLSLASLAHPNNEADRLLSLLPYLPLKRHPFLI